MPDRSVSGARFDSLLQRFRGPFASDVLTLMTGKVAAQVTLVAAAPFLTRLFEPEEFAVFAFFLALANVLSVAASARYDFAVMLPEEDEGAAHVALLALSILGLFSLTLLLVSVLFGDSLLGIFGDPYSRWMRWLLPLAVLIFGARAISTRWQSRKRRFATVAKADIGYGLSAASTQIAGGLFWAGGSAGLALVCGHLVGQAVAVSVLFGRMIGDLQSFVRTVTYSRLKEVASRFANFPLFSVPSGLTSKLTYEVPIFMLGAYFAPEVLGFYALSRRVMATPMAMLGQAVSNVFYQRIATVRMDRERSRIMLLRVASRLFLLIVLPLAVVVFWAEPIFVFVFGDKWESSGTYARLLAPMMCARFVFAPTGLAMLAFERQGILLIWHVVFLVVSAAAFALGYSQSSPTVAILAYSLAAFVMYCVHFGLCLRYAGAISHDSTSLLSEQEDGSEN